MILIDIELRGNAVRLFYGPNSVKSSYHGDDWDDRPLNNCGMVYDEYVSGYVDIGFDLGHRLLLASSCRRKSASLTGSPATAGTWGRRKV